MFICQVVDVECAGLPAAFAPAVTAVHHKRPSQCPRRCLEVGVVPVPPFLAFPLTFSCLLCPAFLPFMFLLLPLFSGFEGPQASFASDVLMVAGLDCAACVPQLLPAVGAFTFTDAVDFAPAGDAADLVGCGMEERQLAGCLNGHRRFLLSRQRAGGQPRPFDPGCPFGGLFSAGRGALSLHRAGRRMPLW